MNSDSPKNPQEKLEASVTSLLLGELPHDQAAELHQKLTQDPELAKLYDRLKETIGVVRETMHSPPDEIPTAPLKLSEERRQKLFTHFKTVTPKEFSEPKKRRRPMWIDVAVAASLAAIAGALLLPTLGTTKKATFGFGRTSKITGEDTMAAGDNPEQANDHYVLNGVPKGASHQAKTVHQIETATNGFDFVPVPQTTPAHIELPKSEVFLVATNYLNPQSFDGTTQSTFAFDDFLLEKKLAKDASPGKPATGKVFPNEGPQGATTANYDTENSGMLAQSLANETGLLYNPTPPFLKPTQGKRGGEVAADQSASSSQSQASSSGPTVVFNNRNPRGEKQLQQRMPPPSAAAPTGSILTNIQNGDPEWIGILQLTQAQSRAGSPFVGGYAYVPPGQKADLDSIHETSKMSEASSSKTISGYVDTSRDWNPGTGNATTREPIGATQGYNENVVALNGTLDKRSTSNTSVAQSKVPELGDIPALGALYRDRNGAPATPPPPVQLGLDFGVTTNSFASGGATVVTLGGIVGGSDPRLSAEKLRSLMPAPAEPPPPPSKDGDAINGPILKTTNYQVLQLADNSESTKTPSSTPLGIFPGQSAQSPQLLAYQNAQRELEDAKAFRAGLDQKIAAETSDAALPKSAMVEMVDKALPAQKKSSSLWDKIRGDTSRDYRSSTRVKIDHDQSDITGLAERRQASGYDPYFVQTEFEALQSDIVLGKVVKDLNLTDEWSKERHGKRLTDQEAIQQLKKHLDLHAVGNTSLIEIGARSDKPDEAARIANAVADAYQDHRKKQRQDLQVAQVKTLEDRFALQEAKVREAQSNVDYLRGKLDDANSTVTKHTETTQVQSGKLTGATADGSRKPATPSLIPQPEIQATQNAFSTFSLNVSDVAFKLAGASLEKGQLPDAGSMRSEEFINAFDYRDPEPPTGVPIAFAWERAQYPFAQNRDLLRFSLKTAALGREPGKPLNLVLLLDNSGSMERADRVEIIHEALKVLASQLQPQDKFSIVTFARTARLWVDGVPGNQAAQAVEAVSGLTPEGGTNLEEAMNTAYATALHHYLANGVNRVVLLTDGAANLGDVDPVTLKQKVESYRKQGVALDCFGIGWEGYNDDLLEQLSRNGDGRYGFINTPEEAASEFAGQLSGALHVAASDVKVQVEFNPARVTAWRQIGYAKHQLTKEQFRDNTVDAAEIGAAESGNALYVIQVNPAGQGPLATVRVRYKVPGTTDYHEHEWPVAYTGNAVPLAQASPAMRLAATAGAFSEWLAASPYATEVTPDSLLAYLSGVPELCGADARPKKLEWMIRQAKSISGK